MQIAAVDRVGIFEQRQAVGVELILQDDGVVERRGREAGVFARLPILGGELGASAGKECLAISAAGRIRSPQAVDQAAEKDGVRQGIGPTGRGTVRRFGLRPGDEKGFGAALADEAGK